MAQSRPVSFHIGAFPVLPCTFGRWQRQPRRSPAYTYLFRSSQYCAVAVGQTTLPRKKRPVEEDESRTNHRLDSACINTDMQLRPHDVTERSRSCLFARGLRCAFTPRNRATKGRYGCAVVNGYRREAQKNRRMSRSADQCSANV